MAQPPKYAPEAKSLVNDHITTTAEDALRVCIVGWSEKTFLEIGGWGGHKTWQTTQNQFR